MDDDKNKYLLFLMWFFVICFFIAVFMLERAPFVYCEKWGGDLYEGDECINITALPYCRDDYGKVYEYKGGFSYNVTTG